MRSNCAVFSLAMLVFPAHMAFCSTSTSKDGGVNERAQEDNAQLKRMHADLALMHNALMDVVDRT
jgi:hypothetical protein